MEMYNNSNINGIINGNEELPDVLKQAGRRIPYSVPEGYFESLADRVIDAVDKLPVHQKRTPVFSLYNRRLRAIAASVAVLLFAGVTYALITEVILPAFNDNQPVQTEDISSKGVQTVGDVNKDQSDDIAVSNDTDMPGSSPLRPSNISPTDGRATTPIISPGKPQSQTPGGVTSKSNVSPFSTNFQTHSQNQPFGTSGGKGQVLSKENSPATKIPVPFFADTVVCKGTILTYAAKENSGVCNFSWFINGAEVKDHNSGSLTINTSQFSYGTQRLSLIVSEGNKRNVVKVYNAAIVVAEPPVITSDRNICGYDRMNISTGKTNPNWEYTWSTGDRTPGIFVARSGKYWVTVRIKGGNCSVTDTFDVKVLAKPSVELGSDRTICTNDKVTLEVRNPSGQYDVTWYPGNVKSDNYDFHRRQPGVYKVRVEVEACNTITREVVIRVNDCNLIIPNVFTPNGDSRNDYFLIRGLENYSGSRLVVTDRNGQVVYENNDYRNDWDGANNPDGTYFYVFYPGGDAESARKGTVSIRR